MFESNNEMQNIYCLPGLGADHRLFSKLKVDTNLIPIKYINAETADTAETYAEKLLDQIKEDNPILMGVSLGGILAIEISKRVPVQKLILISTIKSKNELPPYFSLLDHLPFDISKTAAWFKNYGELLKPFYNKINKEEMDLFKSMLIATPDDFINSGVGAVSHWKNETIETDHIHIHGSYDLVFPTKWVNNYTEIKSGSHFMVVDKADQISPIINEQLKSVNEKSLS